SCGMLASIQSLGLAASSDLGTSEPRPPVRTPALPASAMRMKSRRSSFGVSLRGFRSMVREAFMAGSLIKSNDARGSIPGPGRVIRDKAWGKASPKAAVSVGEAHNGSAWRSTPLLVAGPASGIAECFACHGDELPGIGPRPQRQLEHAEGVVVE